MAVLSTDTFTRANSTSVVGTTDGAGSADPLTWVTQIGTCGINTNKGYASALSSTTGIATVDVGSADVDFSFDLNNLVGSAGVVFRLSDASNYWRFQYFSGTVSLRLNKIVGGVATQVGVDVAGATSAATYRVVANGSSITTYRAGVSVHTATDSFNSTATKFGFYTSNINNTFDNFTASSLTTTTTVTGTQAIETDTANAGTQTSAAIITGTQATETDTANAGTILSVPLTTVVGTQAQETDSTFDGTILIDPIGNRFTPPTELVVPNMAYDAHPTANKWRRYYPLGPRGRAVFKLPDGTYTFHQPYPWVTPDDVGTPTRAFPDPPVGQGDSNLKVQTVDLVYYGGHEYVIDDDEAAALSAFLTEQGYTPSDWITT